MSCRFGRTDDDKRRRRDHHGCGPSGVVNQLQRFLERTVNMHGRITTWGLGAISLLLTACGGDDGGPTTVRDTVPPAAVGDLNAVAGTTTSVTLAWTAPGDDGRQGRARQYDLRYTDFAGKLADFSLWIPAEGVPAPAAGGTAESFTVGGLTENATYIFGIRTRDEADNWSAVSNYNVATASQDFDATAPATITDLRVTDFTDDTITLIWTAPGDDAIYGSAAVYDLRYGPQEITDINWDQMTSVTAPTPSTGGGREQTTVTALSIGTEYYFAIKAADEASNWSGLSNSVRARTSSSRTLYVKVDGTGDAPTIQAAIDSVFGGVEVDEILIAPGRYTWTNQGAGDPHAMIVFPRDVNDVIIRREAGPEQTILDAEGYNRVIHFLGNTVHYYEGVILEDLTITGGDATQSPQGSESGGGVLLHLASPTLRNCIIEQNTAYVGGGVCMAGWCAPLFDGCIIAENSADFGGGFYLVNSRVISPLLLNCVIRNNQASDAGGAVRAKSFKLRLENCTVVRNSAPDGGGIALRDTSYAEVHGTIVALNTRGGAFASIIESTLQIGCGDSYGNLGGNGFPAGTIDAGGNFFSDPKFCDSDGGDYRLRGDSPCAAGNHPNGAMCGTIGALPVGCTGSR